MNRVGLGLLCLSAAVLAGGLAIAGEENAPAASGQIVLRSTPLGPMPTDLGDVSVTPDGQHVAVAANAGSRRDVFIDGNEGQAYSSLVQMPNLRAVSPRLVMHSADETRYAYVSTKGPTEYVMVVNQREGPAYDRINGAVFSPVGHRLAYVASKGGKQIVVLDGTPSAAYQQVSLTDIQFSAGGEHFGFAAQTAPGTASFHAVIDGKEGAAYQSVRDLKLAGSHSIYMANTGGLYDNCAVYDGQAGPKYAIVRAPVLSADGAHYAYAAVTDPRGTAQWVMVIDGQVSEVFGQVGDVVFSPDGKHSAYMGIQVVAGRNATYAVIDGKKSLDYVGVVGTCFSPDSQHVAFIATASNGKQVVVLDGKEGDAHEGIEMTPACFSPDGKHLAYVARDQSKMSLVLDGKAGPKFGAIEPKSIQFTTDSQHCHFKGRQANDAWFFMMDDQSSDSTTMALEMATTPDEQHSAIVAVKDPSSGVQSCQVRLDNKPIGGSYQVIQQLRISNDGAHVAYTGVTDGSEKSSTHAVFDGHEGPAYFRIDNLAISPDGRHIAYACMDATGKHYVVVDSFKGPAYDDVLLGITERHEAMQFGKDGSLSFLPVKDGKLSHVIMTADAIAAIPKPATGAGNGAGAASAPPGFSKLYTFGSVPKDGSLPAVLTAGPDGTLFGGTNGGGKYQMGVLFKCGADGSNYTILHNFAGGQTDGMRPTSIFVGPDGAVYGTLQVQGQGGHGCIFRCSADGSDYKSLYDFTGSDKDGDAPVIDAVEADGTLCGVSGRSGRQVFIFRAKPDGSALKVIFDASKIPGGGQNGVGRFSAGSDGYYYGAAGQILFKIKKDGSEYSVLRKFVGAPTDARYADQAPILASDGNLYGIDKDGGQARGGTIFSLGRDGKGYKLILDPDSGPDQLTPTAIVEGSDGKLYVFVHAGLARVNKDGSGYEVVQAFPNSSGFPWTATVHGGAFYGAADQGPNRGLIFCYGFGGAAGGGGGGGANAEPAAVVQIVPPTPLDAN